jgi:hypothetical protein
MFIGLKVVLSVSGDMLFENEQCVRQQKVEEVTKENETRAVWNGATKMEAARPACAPSSAYQEHRWVQGGRES